VKRLIAVSVAAVLSVSLAGFEGAGASSASTTASSYTPSISLATCADDPKDQCAMFQVPLDWANEDGEKISLAVRVRPHTSTLANYKGLLLANPGGPGQSGTGLSGLADWLPTGVGHDYDVVGWDPRGVGDSVPSLHCNSSYFGVDRPNFVPRTHKLMRYWKKKTRAYAAQCAASSASRLLGHMTTLDNVRDMEALRQAMTPGRALNFYGFSYGSYLGQVYATRYPGVVGRFVLDGVVDPTNYWYGANLKQEKGFDRNLNIFFRWVAKHPRAYHLGTSRKAIRRGYNALLTKLDRKPAFHGKLGPDELTDAILGAAYYVFDWDYIAGAYSRLARSGNGRGMFRLYADSNMGDDNSYAVYLGVQCTDAPAPAWRTQVRDARRIHRKDPFIAWDNTWFNAPCTSWPAPARGLVDVNGAATSALGGKLLLVNETKDAATPYSGALTARSLFPSSALVAGVGGTTHAGSLAGVPCVSSRIAAFLQTGALPARVGGTRADVECPKVPAPAATRYSRTTGSGMPAELQDLLTRGPRIG
jgi:pimeloyl-ACP methyl ester carboxylesterase